LAAAAIAAATSAFGAELRGVVRDSRTGETIPARVYVAGRTTPPTWHFARPAVAAGTAVEYRVNRGEGLAEMHVTLSAHPFVVDVPPGEYVVTVERGKEYHAAQRIVRVTDAGGEIVVDLDRWIDMAARGWYSGDTHVHRPVDDLANLLLAEDLNVALPVTAWVTRAHAPPAATAPRPAPIHVDARHVIYPVNTEYEVSAVRGRRHTLGAVLVLNHRESLGAGVPPVGPVAAAARRQGGLLDLEKHTWPWSLMLVPRMRIDLFELANNHCWRTGFGMPAWGLDTVPASLRFETDGRGFTERGWIEYGLQTYYTLLDCGFRLRPTAGTASGVHPVPLGFSRVYVHLPGGFDYGRWIEGLDAGRSFVTTGPMLFVEFNGRPPGTVFPGFDGTQDLLVTGTVEGARPIDRIEVVVNGEVRRIDATSEAAGGGHRSVIRTTVPATGRSFWAAVRAFEAADEGRVRFAHSAPVHCEVDGRPVVPRRAEVDPLIRRMEEEIVRGRDVLEPDELQEYEDALRVYREIRSRATP
jgi:hypothetical protein